MNTTSQYEWAAPVILPDDHRLYDWSINVQGVLFKAVRA